MTYHPIRWELGLEHVDRAKSIVSHCRRRDTPVKHFPKHKWAVVGWIENGRLSWNIIMQVFHVGPVVFIACRVMSSMGSIHHQTLFPIPKNKWNVAKTAGDADRIVSVDTPSNKPSIILNIVITSIIGVYGGGSPLSIAFLVKSLLPSPTSWNALASAVV